MTWEKGESVRKESLSTSYRPAEANSLTAGPNTQFTPPYGSPYAVPTHIAALRRPTRKVVNLLAGLPRLSHRAPRTPAMLPHPTECAGCYTHATDAIQTAFTLKNSVLSSHLSQTTKAKQKLQTSPTAATRHQTWPAAPPASGAAAWMTAATRTSLPATRFACRRPYSPLNAACL